jgi:hypothetical protein
MTVKTSAFNISMSSPVPPQSKTKHILAGILLGLLLLQLLSFFFGLTVPLNRVMILWGKSVNERLAMIVPTDAAIKNVSDQLPLDARVYLEDPEAVTHKHSVYYFFPRYVTISMTSSNYEGIYDTWNERPTTEWLLANGFTHVLDYKQQRLTPVRPASPQP